MIRSASVAHDSFETSSTAVHDLPPEADLDMILAAHAAQRPNAMAFGLVRDGIEDVERLGYAALRDRAAAVAAHLAAAGLAPGERAILLYESPSAFLCGFLGCLRAGIVAIPAPPPEASRLKRTLPRLLAIARDSDARAILADPPTLAALERMGGGLGALAGLSRLDTTAAAGMAAALAPDPGRIAYLQYTSGSIGAPKGVIVTHAGLMANLAYNQKMWDYNPTSVSVNWMPYFHDYGLVEGLLQPLFSGTPGYVLPTMAFLRRPIRWLRAIAAMRATHAAAPNFGYAHCVERTTPEERVGLDLSAWRIASNGAEVVRRATLDTFATAFAPHGFRAEAFTPSYGLAEATLLLTARRRPGPPSVLRADAAALAVGTARPAAAGGRAVELVACGEAGPEIDLRIVDPDTGRPRPDGVVGEIWARGASIAAGYWNRPEESRATFGNTLVDSPPGRDGGFLRTGDLGFRHGGELYVTGRLKDLVILHGANHAPEDIEASVREAGPATAGADSAAFAVAGADGERLALVAEVARGTAAEALPGLAATLRALVAERHEAVLHVVAFVRRGTLPKTSSGKVQRGACRLAFEAGALEGELGRFGLPDRSPGSTDEPIHEETARDAASRRRADRAIAGLRALAADRLDLHLMDERRTPPPHVVLELGNLGLLGLQVPEAEGGLGLTTADAMRVIEQVGAIDVSLAVIVVLQNGLGLRPLLAHGRPDQRAALLPSLAAGRELAAFAYTEAGAGSNVRAIAAEARPGSDGILRLDGLKLWSGSSAWAGTILTFAREFDADGVPKGISAFVLRRGMAGLSTGAEALTMGMRATIQNRVRLRAVAVGPGDRLGAAGDGLAVAQDAMMFTRLCLAALCLGALKRAVRIAFDFAQGREVITGRLAGHPLTQARLSGHAAAIRALEALVARTADRHEARGAAPPDLLAACKILAPELLWTGVDDALQLLGGRGYMEHNLLAMLHRDARAIRIFEGPTEALRHHLGSRLLGETEALVALVAGTPDLAEDLRTFAVEQAARPAPEAARAQGTERLWRLQAAGEVTAWAILAAIVEETPGADPGLDRARLWARARFAQARAEAETVAPEERAMADAATLAVEIARYAEAIGTGAYDPAGVESGLDPALAAPGPIAASPETALPESSFPEVVLPETTPAPRLAPAAPSETGTDRSPEALADWIAGWLARTLGVPRGTLAPDRAFTSFGMDSVTAVNLAMDLETALGRPVDATLIWDRPSIGALADFLGRRADPLPAPPRPRSAAAELDALLDEFRDL